MGKGIKGGKRTKSGGGMVMKKKKAGGLKGRQGKLDMNKNGRIDGEDFRLLRKKKKYKKKY